MRNHVLLVVSVGLLLCLLAVGIVLASPDTVTVDSTTDDSDGDTSTITALIGAPGDDGVISLWEAIQAANNTPGPDTIEFNIPESDTGYEVGGITGTWTISLTAQLPALTDGGTVISGTSQAANAGGDPNPQGPETEVTGAGMTGYDCFTISSAGNVIHGLVINRCPGRGIVISQASASGNTVSGNYVGTDATGTATLGNIYGVRIAGAAQNNTIGGDTTGERNIISGNEENGVLIWGSGTTTNTVSGNYVGTDAHGATALGNGGDGMHITNGAQHNVIGGDTEGERNLISGNGWSGVGISGNSTSGNTVSGNYVSTDVNGSSPLGNEYGVHISETAQNNVIGGDTEGERNLISGNKASGVDVHGNGTSGNSVSGNYIGTDANGLIYLGNGWFGVDLSAEGNVVGGDTAGERNIISGNDASGVRLLGSGATSNTVSGNYIGTDATGETELGNADDGITIITGAQNNMLGPENHIAHNQGDGVHVSSDTATGNTITQNSIHRNVGLGIATLSGGNTELPPPEDVTSSCAAISGTAPADATVEVFTGPDEEGKVYVATADANGAGGWSVAGPFILRRFVTATATDSDGNTSEFSVEVDSNCYYPVFLPLVLRNH